LFACKGHFSQWWEGIRSGRPICLSDVVFSEGLAISDFIIDLFIIVMPMPMVNSTKHSRLKPQANLADDRCGSYI
jgi:hypothetical protein